MPFDPFPPHDPDFPDVNPATGDERETTGPTAADLRRLGDDGDPWDSPIRDLPLSADSVRLAAEYARLR